MSDAKLRDALRASEKKRREYRDEARRCRAIAKFMADKLQTKAVLAEVYPQGAGLALFICAPNLSEGNLGQAAQIILREFWKDAGFEFEKTFDVKDLGLTGTQADGEK